MIRKYSRIAFVAVVAVLIMSLIPLRSVDADVARTDSNGNGVPDTYEDALKACSSNRTYWAVWSDQLIYEPPAGATSDTGKLMATNYPCPGVSYTNVTGARVFNFSADIPNIIYLSGNSMSLANTTKGNLSTPPGSLDMTINIPELQKNDTDGDGCVSVALSFSVEAYHDGSYDSASGLTSPIKICVAQQKPQDPACTLSASPPSGTATLNTRLSWTSTNATSGTISNNINTNTIAMSPVSSGFTDVSINSTRTYTATVTDGNGNGGTCQTTVTVDQPQPNSAGLRIQIEGYSGTVNIVNKKDSTGFAHGVGNCKGGSPSGYPEKVISVTTYRDCTSSPGNGIGYHTSGHGSGQGGVRLEAPAISGYTFLGWSTTSPSSYWTEPSGTTNKHCPSSLPSNQVCVNIPPGGNGTATARYSQNTSSSTPKAFSLAASSTNNNSGNLYVPGSTTLSVTHSVCNTASGLPTPNSGRGTASNIAITYSSSGTASFTPSPSSKTANISSNGCDNATATYATQSGDSSEICAWVSAAPSVGRTDGTSRSGTVTSEPVCYRPARFPYLSVFGHDTHAGGMISKTIGTHDCTGYPPDAYIVGNVFSNVGSRSQYLLSALQSIQKFGSNNSAVGTSLTFSNDGTSGYFTALGVVCRPDFTQLSTNATGPAGNWDKGMLNNYNGKVVYIDGDVNLKNIVNLSSGAIRVTLVVNGNVYIEKDVSYGPAGGPQQHNPDYNNRSNIPAIAVVASGNIGIDKSAEVLSGIYVANGYINTCVSSSSFNTPNITSAGQSSSCDSGKQLVVYGQLIANSYKFRKTHGSAQPNVPTGDFGNGGTSAAELIRFSPELWLAPPPGFSYDGASVRFIGELPPLN